MVVSDKIKAGAFGIVILAAGSSSRMGQPKQLLEYNGKTLLQHAVDEALGTGIENIVMILGAHAGKIREVIKEDKIRFLQNQDHEEGMASGIRLGVHDLTKSRENMTEGILIMLCDQPFVNSELLIRLIGKQIATGCRIVASTYKGIEAVPAVFHKSVFPELINLKGDRGARSIIKKYGKGTATVEFPKGHIDIDTLEDYRNLTTGNSSGR
ncbi:nucleotidyltransferase family protein [Sinomicrobium weinanense]|uniref:Nucleotidyltransferase family protein n=1 Tax=Sinomicrobium weinanense TaxID=2842200 RepID=A0A926JWQ4_9FLAO|nr:nucleotidyltransferase family protein [Sinomicrobium weinanense]MBC9798561.1 nucleotidyltransferase family protein [Sinomicrobium weinanense]MBU3122718.1 nucleotidyltransferase family protein [Sinomicrobium weinanense]